MPHVEPHAPTFRPPSAPSDAAAAAVARSERLQALTEALAGARTVEEVAEVVVAQAVAATGARTAMLAVRPPGAERAEIVRQAGFTAGVAERYRQFGPETPGPAARCLRTGEPVWVTGIGGDTLLAHFPDAAEVWASFGVAAVATVPLAVAGATGTPEPVGVMSFTWAAPRPLPAEERAFFVALGRQAAQAVERARLLAAEREARAEAERGAERVRRLQQLTAALNRAGSRAEVADVIFAGALEATGADAGSLALVHADAEGRPAEFEVVRTAGYGDELVARYRRFPVRAGGPLSEAVRHGALVAVESAEAWAAAFPDTPARPDDFGTPAFVALPVRIGERVVAALAVGFRTPRAFDAPTRAFLAALAEQCALALERQRLHDAELGHAARHAALLATVQDAFVAYDRDTRFTYVNPPAAALLGHPAAELLGRRLQDVVPETRGSPIYEAIRGTLASGRGTQLEAYSEATRCWLDVRVYPAPDGVSVVFRDVTARRRARDAADFVSDAARLLAGSLDYEATLRAVAEAAVPRLGDWCAVDVVRDPTARAWPPVVDRLAAVHQDPAVRALGDEFSRRYPTDWSAEGGLAGVLRDGTPLFVPEVTDAMLVAGARDAEHLAMLRALHFTSVLVVPLVARGLTLGALTLCTTESGRRYDEADRALAVEVAQRAAVAVDNARLYRAAEQARVQAEQARAEAEAANRAKSEFLAVMSHELRTPLNAIGGYAELLELGIRGPVTAAQREDLGRIQRAQRHLLGLVNGVLNYARLEAGAVGYDVSDVALDEVLAACEALVAPQLRAKGLTLAPAAPARDADGRPLAARADREKVQQIVLNLLGNAVKFTAEGGRVALACEALPAGRVAVRVRDTGRGIAPEHLARVFEPFVQVDARLTRAHEGVGLGLAISRDLARGMGGDLTAESAEGAGSTFTLTLPRAAGPA